MITIKDSLPLMQTLNEEQEIAARKHGIPVFKGKLFRHEGTMNENLDKYGRPIFNFVNSNTVVIGGAVLALEKLFGTTSSFMPRTLNEEFDINARVPYTNDETRIALFGVGIGGCGLEWGTAYDPDFKQANMGDLNVSMIPFRVSPTETVKSNDNGVTPGNYFFRTKIKVGSGDDYYAWYLKEFSNNPVPIRSLWQDTINPNDDGAEITGNVVDQSRTDLIECFGECILTITEDDLREYYTAAGNLKNARFNQIGLFTGVKKEISDYYYDYVGVRLFSVVNFDNVSVKEPTTNTYAYRIYAAV